MSTISASASGGPALLAKNWFGRQVSCWIMAGRACTTATSLGVMWSEATTALTESPIDTPR